MSNDSDAADIGVTLFKRAGICLLDVQAIEKSLTLLLLPTQALMSGIPSQSAIEKTQQALWTMNIGKLQRLCANLVTKDREFVFELDRVRRLRNQFVHGFFMDYLDRVPLISKASDAELGEMIAELDALHVRFISFYERIVKITKKEYKGVDAAVRSHFARRNEKEKGSAP